MAMTTARKRGLALAGAFVATAGAIAMTILPSSSVPPPPDEVRLHLYDGVRQFTYEDTQVVQPVKNSCRIDDADEHIIDLGPTPGGNGPAPGVGPDGIGIKATPSSGNGSPCSQVSGTEALEVSRGTALGARRFSELRLDLELTGNARVKVVVRHSSTSTTQFELFTGPDIPADSDSLDTTQPFEVTSTAPNDLSDNCAAASSSGPNNAANDNCLWTIRPATPFDSFEISTTRGTAALEGSGDFGGNPTFDTLFKLVPNVTANDDTFTTDEDQPLNGNVLTNDANPAGGSLAASLVSGPAAGTGSVSVSSDGSFTFTPAEDYNGSASFTYSASNGTTSDTATVSITVTPVNDAPDGQADEATVIQGGNVDIPVLDNDSDIDGDSLDAVELTPVSPSGAILTPNGDGTVNYAPPATFLGDGTFTYKASDGDLESAAVTVTVHVLPRICGGETVSTKDPDDPEEPPLVTGSFTMLELPSVCKGFVLESDSEAQGGDGTVLFVPQGEATGVRYRGVLTFPADEPPVDEYPLLLQYDPTPTGDLSFQPVKWCVNPTFGTDGLVETATLPDDGNPETPPETWCVAKAVTTPNVDGDLVTEWQVYGEDDPMFSR